MWQYIINNYVLDDIIGNTIEYIREIELLLKILFADKISGNFFVLMIYEERSS